MSKSTVTASQVREFLNADPKRLAALSPEARATVEPVDGKSPRGRLHKDAVALHNKRRRGFVYETGATNTAKREQAEAAAALRAEAREAGYEVGQRGPLPKQFLATRKG